VAPECKGGKTLSVFFAESDLVMFSMFGQRGPHKKMAPTGHSCATFSGQWVRHSCGAARQSLPCKYYKTYEFRKPYLNS